MIAAVREDPRHAGLSGDAIKTGMSARPRDRRAQRASSPKPNGNARCDNALEPCRAALRFPRSICTSSSSIGSSRAVRVDHRHHHGHGVEQLLHATHASTTRSPKSQPLARADAQGVRTSRHDPQRSRHGEWHLPLLLRRREATARRGNESKLSVARCARVCVPRPTKDCAIRKRTWSCTSACGAAARTGIGAPSSTWRPRWRSPEGWSRKFPGLEGGSASNVRFRERGEFRSASRSFPT